RLVLLSAPRGTVPQSLVVESIPPCLSAGRSQVRLARLVRRYTSGFGRHGHGRLPVIRPNGATRAQHGKETNGEYFFSCIHLNRLPAPVEGIPQAQPPCLVSSAKAFLQPRTARE